ncbi:MAG TPA: hypothetical protein VFA45_07500 [Actinomycetes bacterium]|jgi:hypothetical protein|nr:hypothetical protein [Actinomycetes bacterium]
MSGAARVTARERPAGAERARWIALVVLCADMLMIIHDHTIVNVALPSIRNDPGFSHGWGSNRTLGLGTLSIALLAGFAVHQARTSNPLVPLRIFRSRTVSAANLIQTLMVAGLLGMFFLGSL